MAVSCQLQAPSRFIPGKNLYAVWLLAQFYTFWKREKFLGSAGVEAQTVQALAWSLYKLRFPGSAFASPWDVLIYKHTVLAGDFV